MLCMRRIAVYQVLIHSNILQMVSNKFDIFNYFQATSATRIARWPSIQEGYALFDEAFQILLDGVGGPSDRSGPDQGIE